MMAAQLKGDCSIKVTTPLEYLDLSLLHVVGIFELDPSTPLEYTSMQTGTNSQIGHLSGFCATGAVTYFY